MSHVYTQECIVFKNRDEYYNMYEIILLIIDNNKYYYYISHENILFAQLYNDNCMYTVVFTSARVSSTLGSWNKKRITIILFGLSSSSSSSLLLLSSEIKTYFIMNVLKSFMNCVDIFRIFSDTFVSSVFGWRFGLPA